MKMPSRFLLIFFLRVIQVKNYLQIVSFLSIMYKSYRNIVYTFDIMVKAFLPENQFQTTMEAYIRILQLEVFFCFGRRKRGNYVRKDI